MTISSTTTRNQYTGNNSTTVFAYSFKIFADADLLVILTDTSGVETVKTLTTHYTVSGAGTDSGGNVTFTSGNTPGTGVIVTILRNTAITQSTDYVENDTFPAASHETALDRLTAIDQHQQDRIDRSLKAPDSEASGYSMTLPAKASRLGTVLGFNATSGNPEAGPKIADVSSLASITADISTLADIEDGTDATNAIQTVAGISGNVSTVAGISANVTTVAGITSNIAAVVADATDIGAVANKADEIGRLGTSAAVTDLSILGTSDAVSDMNTLAAISSNISTVAGISSNVTTVAGVASLITSDFVSDLNTLATSDIVSDLNTLATADIVSDLNTLATSDIVSDLNTLATSDIVTDMNLLATSDVIADMAALAGSGGAPNISALTITKNSGTGVLPTLTILCSDTTAIQNQDLGQIEFQTSDSNETGTVSKILATRTNSTSDSTNEGALEFYTGRPGDLSLSMTINADHTVTFANNITASGTVTATGTSVFASLDISGDIDVDGTTNLDVVDIDGAVDMASTLKTSGHVAFNGAALLGQSGISEGVLNFDSGSNYGLEIKDTGTGSTGTSQIFYRGSDAFGSFASNSNNFLISSTQSDKDLIFKGNDGGATITALTLDMSEAGAATFNSGATFGGSVGIGTSSPLRSLHIAGSGDTGLMLQTTAATDDSEIWEIQVAEDSGSLANLVFRTRANNGTGGSEAMRLNSQGNLGIGDTSPDRKLHVKSGTDNVVAKFESTDSIASIELVDSAGGTAEIGGEGNQIVFFPGGTDKGRINADGKFLIGNATSQTTDLLQIESPASGGGHGIAIRRNDNNTDQQLGLIRFGNTVDSDIGQIHVKTTGAANTGAMIFSTASSGTTTERITIDSDGDVIVGNSSTSITTGTLSASNKFLELQGSGGAGALVLSRDTSTNDAVLGQIRFANRNNADDDGEDADGKLVTSISSTITTSDSNAGDDSGGNLLFFTKPEAGNITERMRLTADGSFIVGGAVDGASSTITLQQDGDIRGVLASGAGGDSLISAISGVSNGYQITVDTSNNQTYKWHIGGAQSMTLDANGNFLLGDTNLNPIGNHVSQVIMNAANGTGIHRDGGTPLKLGTDGNREILIFHITGADVGSIDVSGTSTSYTTSSDHRLKTDVQVMTGATDRLKQLKPVNFEWIADGTRVDGFLAHEAQAVVPEAITGTHNEVDDDGNPVYQGIDQSKLVPLLVATIQELEARITALEGA